MKAILEKLFNHSVLSQSEAENVMLNITRNQYNDNEISSFISVYRMRNIEVEELLGFRNALLQSRVKLNFDEFNPIDIVGTGGDGKNTFNISTCACFVVAGAGYKVAKHGNYGASSISGASNVIELHGVKFTNDESKLKESIDKCGVAYLHAPLFTPALKSVAGIRKSLKFKNLFNMLGPLVNPCLPKNQLLGTADLTQLRLYTIVYQKLDINYYVVNSLDGYDEISLTSDFKVSGNNETKVYNPEEIGFNKIKQEEIFGGKTAEEAKQIFDNILDNKAKISQKNCVLANAAFAIKTINRDKSIAECLNEAEMSLESGRAAETFKKFVTINS